MSVKMIWIDEAPSMTYTQVAGYSTVLGCLVSLTYVDNDWILAVALAGNTKPNEYFKGFAGQYVDFNRTPYHDKGGVIRKSVIPTSLYDSEAGQVLYGKD